MMETTLFYWFESPLAVTCSEWWAYDTPPPPFQGILWFKTKQQSKCYSICLAARVRVC